MGWFHNLNVGSKLLLSYIIVLVTVLGAGAYVLISMKNNNSNYSATMVLSNQRMSYITASELHLAKARVIMREIFYPENTREDLNRLSDELDENLNGLLGNLNDLHDIASPAVKEMVQSVLPLVEILNRDTKDAIGILLATSAISIENPDYRAALIQAEKRTADIRNIYANEMVETIEDISGTAISVLVDLAGENDAKANQVLLIAIIVITVSILIFLGMALYIPGLISKPLAGMSAFMAKASDTGDIRLRPEDEALIAESLRYRNELSDCVMNAALFVRRMSEIEGVLKKVAGGDLTVNIEVLSDYDTMGQSLRIMTYNLKKMFDETKASAAKAEAAA